MYSLEMEWFGELTDMSRNERKILVVEDDICLETIVSRILFEVDPNIEYTWVSSAEAAKDKLKRENFSMVLADLFLEGTETGLDLWQYCEEKYPELPVIIMSGMGVDKFFDLIGPSNITPTYIPKPFYPGECKQVIQSLLDSGH